MDFILKFTTFSFAFYFNKCSIGGIHFYSELKYIFFISNREKVVKFNAENKWKKRGIAMIPTKFGIAFTAPHLNQGLYGKNLPFCTENLGL